MTNKRQFDELEVKFIPKKQEVPAVILAAGQPNETMDVPPALVNVRGKPIIEHIAFNLHKSNIDKMVVVRGFKKDCFTVNSPTTSRFEFFDNDQYQETGLLYSLLMASKHLTNGFVYVHGDLLFDHELLGNLMRSSGDIVLSIDRADCSPGESGDYVETVFDYSEKHTSRILQSDKDDRILHIGQKNVKKVNGEFVGLAYFNARGAKALFKMVDDCKQMPDKDANFNDVPFHEAQNFKKASFTDAIQELIDRGVNVSVSNTYKGWMDIDNMNMYHKAQQTDFK